jgi:hypothetical protein
MKVRGQGQEPQSETSAKEYGEERRMKGRGKSLHRTKKQPVRVHKRRDGKRA